MWFDRCSVYVAFRTPFCLWLRFFLFGEFAVVLVYRVEGVAATIGLGCITSVHVVFRLPFCLWWRFFLSGESVVVLICRVEGVAATIGLGCVTSVHVGFRLPFCLWWRFFLSGESAVVHLPRLLCRQRLATVIQVWVCRCSSPLSAV